MAVELATARKTAALVGRVACRIGAGRVVVFMGKLYRDKGTDFGLVGSVIQARVDGGRPPGVTGGRDYPRN